MIETMAMIADTVTKRPNKPMAKASPSSPNWSTMEGGAAGGVRGGGEGGLPPGVGLGGCGVLPERVRYHQQVLMSYHNR